MLCDATFCRRTVPRSFPGLSIHDGSTQWAPFLQEEYPWLLGQPHGSRWSSIALGWAIYLQGEPGLLQAKAPWPQDETAWLYLWTFMSPGRFYGSKMSPYGSRLSPWLQGEMSSPEWISVVLGCVPATQGEPPDFRQGSTVSLNGSKLSPHEFIYLKSRMSFHYFRNNSMAIGNAYTSLDRALLLRSEP
jgi:hypothetical protein